MGSSRGPGQRAGLTRPAVLAAARDLLAEGGVDALTMRALAQRLRVAPNALYSHFENKTELLDALLDDLLADIDPPSPAAPDPLHGVRDMMSATYRLLVAHPDLVPLYLARQGARGPNAVRLGEILDTLLVRAGVSGTAVAEARRALIIHAIGSAAFAIAPRGGAPGLALADAERSFGRSLRWLLAGIASAVATPKRASSRSARAAHVG